MSLALLAFSPLSVFARRQEKPPQPLKQDEACLACHGQPDMQSAKCKSISIRPEQHAASVHGTLGCKDCHTSIKDFPHPAKVAKVQCERCHAEQVSDAAKSIHAALGEEACFSCHGNVHEIAPAAKLQPAKCAECHGAEAKELSESIHGQAAKSGDGDAPDCLACHGPAHKIQSSSEPTARVAKKNQPAACAQCHTNPGFLTRHKIPVLHPVEQYLQSVHGRAVLQGKDAAVCSDCHGGHRILPARDAQSTVSHWNVAATCAQCHKDIARQYNESVHGEALKAGARDAPVCTDCHGEHLIVGAKEAESPVSAGRVSTVTCGRCHGDQRLAERYNMPADRVPSYADSYHGLAMREGSQTVANCASCHGVHNIFPSSDPRSTVSAANLPRTCGKCHPGAGEKFAIGAVHMQVSAGPAHPVVKWIRIIYWVLIPLTLGFMVLHNLIDFLRKLIHRQARHESGREVTRMNIHFRIAHWGVMLSFPTLVFTGFALKYPASWWAQPLLLWENHVAFRGTLHRASALILLAAVLYHSIHLAVNRRDRVILKAMLPRLRDIKDLVQTFLYNLGMADKPPEFAKFSYAEKLEYWAFLWGVVIMAISGFLLWFNNFALRHFPKWTADAATAVHWYEALLATFSILLWHFYLVIFDPVVYPMDLAWLNGKVPADHYRHARPQYLGTLEEGSFTDASADPGEASKDQAKPAVLNQDDVPPDTSS